MIVHTPRLPHGFQQPEGAGFDTAPLGFPMVALPATDVLVPVEPGTDAQGIAAAVAAVGATAAPLHGGEQGAVIRVAPGPGLDGADAMSLLPTQPAVALAEPDVTVSIAAVSNDPTYTSGGLWGMYGDTTPVVNVFGSQAGEAWAQGKVGSTATIIGVVDSGIDYTHPDLYLNIWLNQGEIPSALRSLLADVDSDGLITFRDLNHDTNSSFVVDLNTNGRIDAGDLLDDSRWDNGVDEDGNGYRDDLVGWDFVNDHNNPFDDHGHGTHVAGTIGAVGGNGLGVAGVAWNVQMVPLKFLGSDNRGAMSDAVKAIDYFTSAATRAVAGENFVATNNSWIGDTYNRALDNAVKRAANEDILFIVAAGNGGSDNIGDSNDATPTWPANLNTQSPAGYDAVISVASITSTGVLSSFSNYGPTTVDIAAPGSGVTSTLPGDGYGTWNGTSMATPHVTGAAALYAALKPLASAAEIKAAILESAAPTPSLAGLVATGGRLDVGALVNGVAPPPPPIIPDETAFIRTIIDNFGPVRGPITAGARIDDATPTLTGRLSSPLEEGESLVVYRNGEQVGIANWTAAGTGANWTFTEASPVPSGHHSWSVRVEHVSGGVGTSSAAFSATIHPDETANIRTILDNFGALKGPVASGSTTDDTTPTLTGWLSSPLEEGESLVVYRNGQQVGIADWTASGTAATWRFTEASPVPAGHHSWSVRVEHVSGEVGTTSAAFSATIHISPRQVFGTAASDTIGGTLQDEIISGLPASGSVLGAGTRDALTGALGNDIFMLGDHRGIFYNDGDASSPGLTDYAFIRDFSQGDRIQLSDDVSDYFFVSTRVGTDSGLGIYADLNSNGSFDASDELIAILRNVLSLQPSDLVFA